MSKNTYTPKKFSSIREMMDLALEEAGEKTAYRFKNRDGDLVSVTYRSFHHRVEDLGCALTARGFGSSHIACVGENSYVWITTYLAVLQSAGVFVPVDKELPPAEMLHVLTDSDAEVIFYDEKYEPFLREHREELSGVKCFVGFNRSWHEGDYLSYARLLDEGSGMSRVDYRALHSDENEMKLLVYTSGTTGVAKGVMLTEHNLVSTVYYGLALDQICDVGLSVLPYHHTYESVCGLLVSIHFHATLCINDSLKNVTRNLQLFQPEHILVVPAFAEAFRASVLRTVRKQGQEKLFARAIRSSNALRKIGIDMRHTLFKDIHAAFGGHLQRIVCGGAPIRPEIGKFFDDIGIVLTNGYGITECSPLVCVNLKASKDFETAGHRLACLEWRIDDPNEEGIGEICVKGDNVMKGYYKQPVKTAEVIKDSWFYTGDYGRIRTDDTLVITGRKKNIIVLNNGKNIYPEELENYIQSIADVNEVVVRGIRNEAGEETGLEAEIYTESGKTEAELLKEIQKVLAPLAGYKQINRVILRAEPFVKTTTNKIKRNAK